VYKAHGAKAISDTTQAWPSGTWNADTFHRLSDTYSMVTEGSLGTSQSWTLHTIDEDGLANSSNFSNNVNTNKYKPYVCRFADDKFVLFYYDNNDSEHVFLTGSIDTGNGNPSFDTVNTAPWNSVSGTIVEFQAVNFLPNQDGHAIVSFTENASGSNDQTTHLRYLDVSKNTVTENTTTSRLYDFSNDEDLINGHLTEVAYNGLIARVNQANDTNSQKTLDVLTIQPYTGTTASYSDELTYGPDIDNTFRPLRGRDSVDLVIKMATGSSSNGNDVIRLRRIGQHQLAYRSKNSRGRRCKY
jgi:hypothetical protein